MFNDFQYTALFIELFINIVGVALGVVLIFRARDNRLMLTWGIYTVLVMGLLIYSNVLLITDYDSGEVVRGFSLLNIDSVMITFLVTTMATIFPIMSLRPSWMNLRRRSLMSIPILLSFIVVYCFYWFDGAATPLHRISDIFAQIHRPDVQMRVAIFCLSIVTPIYFLAIPFFHKWVSSLRRISRGMYFYSAATLVMVTLYFFNVTTDNMFVFYTYGYALILVPIVVSVVFLYNENPLSQPIADSQIDHSKDNLRRSSDVMSPAIFQVYERMDQYMATNTPFIEASYSIEQLAAELNENQNSIIRAIRERGFSGYSEYISFLRVEHFKVLARRLPGLSIKELMLGSGFTSRSSFYRRFSQQEHISPKEFIERKL